MNAEAFLRAWKRWDDEAENMPRFPTQFTLAEPTRALEVFCKELAESLGIATTELRESMAASRREGLSYRAAYDRVMGLRR